MATETILQHWVLTEFVYPFLIIFAIVFGVLEKTKLFGEGKRQLNAILSFVIGLIFVAFVSPKLLVQNLILFLSVAIVVVFIILLIWGFIVGEEPKFSDGTVKIVAIVIVVLALVIFMFLATGIWDTVIDALFRQNWSSDVWTNIIFILVLAAAMAIILKTGK